MSPEHTPTAQPPTETARPSRLGKFVVGGAIVLASVGAILLARITLDPSLSTTQRQARAQIRGLESRVKNYYKIIGRYPSQAENFYPLIQVGLLDGIPSDPWGRPYMYRMENGKGYILSLGEDGLPGGTGDAADIISGGVLTRAYTEAEKAQMAEEKR
jgi:general secretion pathway protein G